jgi:bifunctional non-homologous end joining protein LigD
MTVPAYRPQLATLVAEPPRGPGWIHEIKHDGWRMAIAIARGAVRLVSRQGKDWTRELAPIAGAARSLAVAEALLDGEAVVVLPDGRTSFQALQNALGAGPPAQGRARRRGPRAVRPARAPPGLAWIGFDLLWLDGEDLGRRPCAERRERLRRLLDGHGPVLRFSEAFEGEGPAVFREACRLGLEGIVSKRADQPHHAGRAGGWRKAKCLREATVVVGGFTDMEGSTSNVGALLAGVRDGEGLRFAGKVGTGWTDAESRALRRRLAAIASEACPFTPRPPGWLGRHAHWVEPRLFADVLFTEWTDDGMLRHPRFRGIREAAATAPATATSNRSPRITNADRILYPDAGLTKGDVAAYYEAIAPWMLPHVRGRPLTLVHCPEGLAGECRYMKHSKRWAPEALRRVRIPEQRKIGEYLVVEDAAGLVALAQMGVLEVHVWSSTTAALEEPDRVVVDLDPGPEVPWREVVSAAVLARDALKALGLESFVKTTGGVGLHVVVPVVPERDWRARLAFARAFAETLVRHDPGRFTVRYAKAGRERKILLDYLRNNRTNTSVAAYSTRAKPLATVSAPLDWDELTPRLRPERFTVRTMLRRMKELRVEPWERVVSVKQRIGEAEMRGWGGGSGADPPRELLRSGVGAGCRRGGVRRRARRSRSQGVNKFARGPRPMHNRRASKQRR